MKIYLAGAVFSFAERHFNLLLAQGLRERGYEVWLPQEHELESQTSQEDQEGLFNSCIDGIDWCEVVLANMDGADPESGTCGECGYAYRKRPIVAYRTDFRRGGEGGRHQYNLMLSHFATFNLDLSFMTNRPPTNETMVMMIDFFDSFLVKNYPPAHYLPAARR